MTDMLLLQAAGAGGFNPMMIILLAMFGVMYFFMIRPQQKKAKEQKSFLEDLKKGDRIVTMGGIHGKIVQVNPDSPTVLVEVAEGTKLKIDRSVVSMEYTDANYKEVTKDA
ncbi:MAG: preprotein translocase subunit YajC [Bacteroidetes bacterium]|nr:preprotein translocase subunit YajC [Bacteroidota bacterium]